MAEYTNDLRLKEIATGDESGTWGTSTNTNLELIAEAFSYSTVATFDTDADKTETIADGSTDPYRSIYVKVTSGVSLTATRTLTIAPNTVSKIFMIENATSGSQSIAISQGSGANVTIPNGDVKVIYTDGAGAGAAVVDAFANLKVTDAAQTNITSVGTLSSLTVSGDLTVDTDTFYVDSTNNRIGIGTTSPNASSVHVDGGGQNSALFLYSNDTDTFITISDDDGAAEIRTKDGGALQFSTGGTTNTLADSTTAMYIDSSQDVGIGTTSPSTSLHVRKDQDSSGNTVIIQNEDSGASAAAVLTMDAQGNSFNLITYGDGTSSANVTEFKSVTGSSEFAFSPSSTEKMRIDSSGNVGIGTSSPTALLHVAGDARIGASGATSQLMGMVSSGGVFEITTSSAVGKIHLAKDVGIGTSSPDQLLHISAAADPAIRIENTDTTATAGQTIGKIEFEGQDASTNAAGVRALIDAQYAGVGGQGRLKFQLAQENSASLSDSLLLNYGTQQFFTSGSEAMRIDSDGDVLIGTTADIDVGSSTDTGHYFSGAGAAIHYRDGNTALYVGRQTNDGELIQLRQGGSVVGSIGTQNWGIGTSSPSAPLHVVGSEVLFDNPSGDFTLKLNTNAVGDKNEIIMGDTGTPLVKFGVGGAANDIITGSDAQDFNIGTSGGGRAINFSTDNYASVEMKFDGGNLGIGTTSPAAKLHVQVGSGTTPTLNSSTRGVFQRNTFGGGDCGIALISGNNASTGAFIDFGDADDVDDGKIHYATNNRFMAFHTAAAERMRIGSTGQLDVTPNTGVTAINLKDGGTGGTNYGFIGGGNALKSGGSANDFSFRTDTGNIDFYTGGQNLRFRVNSGGAVEVKSDSLLVNSAVKADSEVATFYGGTNNTKAVAMFNNRATGSFNVMQTFYTGTTPTLVGRIDWDNTGSAMGFTNISDGRFKEVTGEAKGLELINKLNPVKYYFKDNDWESEGLIAQEVEKVFEELDVPVKGVRKPDEDNEQYMLDYSVFTTNLIKAVKELSAEVDELKRKVN